jgi:hypothetical protein
MKRGLKVPPSILSRPHRWPEKTKRFAPGAPSICALKCARFWRGLVRAQDL